MGNIVRKANNTLSDKLREKETRSCDFSPKQYRNKKKISAGLLPRASVQPWVTTLTKKKASNTNPKETIKKGH